MHDIDLVSRARPVGNRQGEASGRGQLEHGPDAEPNKVAEGQPMGGLSRLSGAVGGIVTGGADWAIVQLALVRGIRDENRLTDIAFLRRHRERRGRPIRPGELQLRREWLDLRDRIVRPAMHAGIGRYGQSEVAVMPLLGNSAQQMRALRLEGELEEHEDHGAPSSLTYDEILKRIRHELTIPFHDPNDPGLVLRLQRLRGLFASVPADRTRDLYARLGEQATRDELSRLFHGRLATATRRDLLKILHDRFPAALAPAPPPAAPTVVSPREPLPPADKARFQAALDSLRQLVAASNDARVWRYNCWLSKLAAGADDRVIEWNRICPSTSGAIGAAYVVGPCDIGAGMSVDQAALQAAIKSIPDVEPANQRLGFITYMRSDILFDYQMTSPQFHLENFRRMHDEVNAAIVKLDQWANSPMGGSSAMPTAYVSIKDWIGMRQRDPNSVYSCL